MNLRYEFYGNGMWLLREVSGWLRWLRQGSFIDSPLKLANLCRKCSNKAKNKWLNGCCQKRSKKKTQSGQKSKALENAHIHDNELFFIFFMLWTCRVSLETIIKLETHHIHTRWQQQLRQRFEKETESFIAGTRRRRN